MDAHAGHMYRAATRACTQEELNQLENIQVRYWVTQLTGFRDRLTQVRQVGPACAYPFRTNFGPDSSLSQNLNH
ncbi:MAG: hypothetical protein ACPHJ3_08170, partial [Rubripirellula sp.]